MDELELKGMVMQEILCSSHLAEIMVEFVQSNLAWSTPYGRDLDLVEFVLS